MKSNSSLSKLIPVMLCFFAMGFVDNEELDFIVVWY